MIRKRKKTVEIKLCFNFHGLFAVCKTLENYRKYPEVSYVFFEYNGLRQDCHVILKYRLYMKLRLSGKVDTRSVHELDNWFGVTVLV